MPATTRADPLRRSDPDLEILSSGSETAQPGGPGNSGAPPARPLLLLGAYPGVTPRAVCRAVGGDYPLAGRRFHPSPEGHPIRG